MVFTKRALVGLAALCGILALAGCDAEKRAERATAKKVADKASTGVRRCGDFIDEAEAKELGLEEYSPNKGDENPKRGVVCSTYPVVFTVHMGDRYPEMLAGAKLLKDMKVVEGPKLGKEVFWFETPDVKQVMLLTDSGNYAIGASAPDMALLEKTVRLAAKGR